MKRDATDAAFSDAVREAADWTCQRCGREFPDRKGREAQCSHFYSRKYSSTRWYPDNALLACASCHAIFEPIGLAFENFDATGRWRESDEGAKIDSVATTPRGDKISGSAELSPFLLKRGDDYLRTVTGKLLAYALGREIGAHDAPVVRELVRQAAPGDWAWVVERVARALTGA